MVKSFEGKAALVTGAAGGIGGAVAFALAEAGADVALCDLAISASNVTGRGNEFGRRAMPLPTDVSDQAAVETMGGEVVEALGRIDFLVTCAVYSDREPFTTAAMAGFRRTIDVSFWGSFYCLRACANAM